MLRDRLERANEAFAATPEFWDYRPYEEDVLRWLAEHPTDPPPLLARAEVYHARLVADLDGHPFWVALITHRVAQRVMLGIVLVLILCVGLLSRDTVVRWEYDSFDIVVLLTLGTIAAALLGMVLLFGVAEATRHPSFFARLLVAHRDLAQAHDLLEAAEHSLMLESIREALTVLLRDDDIIQVPSKAPALVELSLSEIVPTRALNEIVTFIEQHQASALGVAGSRGAGKSTVLRAVSQPTQEVVGVYIPAPVRYAPGELARQIHLSAVRAVQLISGGRDRSRERRRFVVRQALLMLAFGWSVLASSLLWQEPPRRAIFLSIGTPILGWVIVSLGLRLGGSPWSKRPLDPHRSDYLTALAEQSLRRLRYREQRENKSGISFQFLKGKSSAETTESLTELDVTRVDVVDELRRFLTDVLRAPNINRVVIAVDELDKLPTVDDLIGVVNDLKDLFHIEGTHFLVAVSNEALDRFVLRGLPSRDAFDSAFDSILHVGQLDPNEADRIMRRRAVGFPIALTLFCWAWSDGVARDLIRTARRCVEIAREGEQSLRGLIAMVTTEGVAERTSSVVRSAGLAVCLTPSGHATLRSAIDAGVDGLDDLIQLFERPELSTHDETIPALIDWLHTARAVWTAFGGPSRSYLYWEEAAGPEGSLREELAAIVHAARRTF